jgi:CheY-like chemotaxis protein
LAGHVSTLSRNCDTILEEIITFKRNLAAQDTLLSNLYQILAHQFNNNNNDNVNVNINVNDNDNSSGLNPANNNNTTNNNSNNSNDTNTTTNTSTITDNTTSSNRRYSSISLNPSINSTNNDDYHNSGGLPSSFMSSIQDNLMLNTLIRSSITTSTDNNNNTSTNLSSGESSSILPLMNDMFSEAYAVAVNAAQQTTLNLNQFNTPNPSPPITTATNNRLFFRGNSVPNWSIQPKILFVDDELFTREGSNHWFQAYGCQFDVAADGITAVNKVQIHQYDIIFMVIIL